MIQRIIDNFKASASSAVRQTSLAAFAALTALVTFCFLGAAGFIFMLDRYGAIAACLAAAGLFLIATLITMAVYASRRRQIEERTRERARLAARNPLADPIVVTTGLQLARAMGIKRVIPLLAVGALALGFLMSRGHAEAPDQTPAE